LVLSAIVLLTIERAAQRIGFKIAPARTVTYLGPTTNETRAALTAPQHGQPQHEAARPETARPGSNDDDSAATPLITPQNPDVNSVAFDGSEPLRLINDSLVEWQRAFNVKDIKRFLSFYDSSSFHYPGGDYRAWVSEIRNNGLRGAQNNSSIHIDSVWLEAFTPPFLKISLEVKEVASGNVVHKRYSMVWRQTPDHWNIIREKQKVFQ
jgi:hypothetical protein